MIGYMNFIILKMSYELKTNQIDLFRSLEKHLVECMVASVISRLRSCQLLMLPFEINHILVGMLNKCCKVTFFFFYSVGHVDIHL